MSLWDLVLLGTQKNIFFKWIEFMEVLDCIITIKAKFLNLEQWLEARFAPKNKIFCG